MTNYLRCMLLTTIIVADLFSSGSLLFQQAAFAQKAQGSEWKILSEAVELYKQGRQAEAGPLLKRALAISEKNMGP